MYDGPTLRSIRKNQRLSLGRVARAAGMTRRQLSRIEQGQPHQPVTPAILAAYEKSTGVRLSSSGTHRPPNGQHAEASRRSRARAASLAHGADADPLPVVTGTVADGDTVRVGECELEVIHLVGHTPGSVALLYRDREGYPHLFTGDSLFPGGVGNTHGSRDNFESLINDVERKIFDRLPDDTWFYPGHGNDSTLGTERPAIPQWRARGW